MAIVASRHNGGSAQLLQAELRWENDTAKSTADTNHEALDTNKQLLEQGAEYSITFFVRSVARTGARPPSHSALAAIIRGEELTLHTHE